MPEIYGVEAYSPREIARKVEEVGVAKTRLPLLEIFMLGMLAGGFVGLGGLFYTVISSGGSDDPVVRFLAGVAFSMGYMVAIIAGAEVFTSNALQVMTWAAGKISAWEMLRKWAIVLCANAVGAIGLVLIVTLSSVMEINDRAMAHRALEIAAAKTGLSFRVAFFNGVLGNLLVCIAVWVSIAGRSVTDKLLATLLPLSAMAVLGMEHVVASLYYIPRGMALRFVMPDVIVPGIENITAAGLLANVIPVILGNIVGGSVLVALVYYVIYRRKAT